MASLKEIKNRIGSIRGTLKITSAMKMVASAKLHRVQDRAKGLAEYQHYLSRITLALCSDTEMDVESSFSASHKAKGEAIVVVFSSDSALCGGYNINTIRELIGTMAALKKEGYAKIIVYPIGEKVAQASRKLGYTICDDFRHASQSTDFEAMQQLADKLMAMYASGEADRVVVVHNHFVSMGRQEPMSVDYLPFSFDKLDAESQQEFSDDYICEPPAKELLAELVPFTLRMKLCETLIDSQTAEHAARTVAMQTASDNAHTLLDDLSLTYNKRRQQAITNELADITQADL